MNENLNKANPVALALHKLGVLSPDIQRFMSRQGHGELSAVDQEDVVVLERCDNVLSAVQELEEALGQSSDKATTIWDAELNKEPDALLVFRVVENKHEPFVSIIPTAGRAADAWERDSGGYVIRPEPDLVELLMASDRQVSVRLRDDDGEEMTLNNVCIRPIWEGENISHIIVEGTCPGKKE